MVSIVPPFAFGLVERPPAVDDRMEINFEVVLVLTMDLLIIGLEVDAQRVQSECVNLDCDHVIHCWPLLSGLGFGLRRGLGFMLGFFERVPRK